MRNRGQCVVSRLKAPRAVPFWASVHSSDGCARAVTFWASVDTCDGGALAFSGRGRNDSSSSGGGCATTGLGRLDSTSGVAKRDTTGLGQSLVQSTPCGVEPAACSTVGARIDPGSRHRSGFFGRRHGDHVGHIPGVGAQSVGPWHGP